MPDIMEISFDEVERIMAFEKAVVDRDHEALDCDEEVFCAIAWRMRGDFRGELGCALVQEVGVLADLRGASCGHCVLSGFEGASR